MKCVLLASLFLFVKGEILMFDVFPKIAEKCNKDVELMKEFPGLIDKGYQMSHDAKCFMACFHKTYELMGDDGRYHESKIPHALKGVDLVNPEVYDKMKTSISTCIKEVEANPDPDYCVHSENFAKCAFRVATELGLPPEKYYVANLEDVQIQ